MNEETYDHRDQQWDHSIDASRDRVEGLWRQVVSRRSSSRSELAAARESRARAETQRQHMSSAMLEATRQACKDLVAEAEKQLAAAREADEEARKKLEEAEYQMTMVQSARWEADTYREKVMTESQEEAQEEAQAARSEADSYREKVTAQAQEEAQAARSEADSYREKVMAQAQEEGQRIRDEARTAAMHECEELKRHVSYEVQCMLSEIDTIRAAAEEELEAQRIYSEAASMKAMSPEMPSQIMAEVEKLLQGMSSEESYVPALGNGNGNGHHEYEEEAGEPVAVLEPTEGTGDHSSDESTGGGIKEKRSGRRRSRNGKG